MGLAVELVAVDKLIPYARNARTHSEEQIAQVAASIREFGFNNPILVDENFGVIAGHGRLLAARKLEMDQVPVCKLSHLSESQRKAYIIADNKLAINAGWDNELLVLEFEELKEFGTALELTGFDTAELNVLFNGWQSDIDIRDKDGSNLDGIEGLIRIGVKQVDKDFARETVTNALDAAGIEYELK